MMMMMMMMNNLEKKYLLFLIPKIIANFSFLFFFNFYTQAHCFLFFQFAEEMV